ncbi:MAG: nucleotidyl transferase AbiEii/AbiGii toxin family protein [Bacteroidota bacterium]
MDGINHTVEDVLRSLSGSTLMKDFCLVGGTALAIQINKRISEDLDFCVWQDRVGKNVYEIKWAKIEEVLESEFSSVRRDLIDLQHVNFIVNDVKLTFFVRENVNSNVIQSIPLINDIECANVESIGVMKLELLQRRNLYRDYYDIYSILQQGYNIEKLLSNAIEYSKDKLKAKSVLSILANAERFRKENEFELLNPDYEVTSDEIRDYIIDSYKKIIG